MVRAGDEAAVHEERGAVDALRWRGLVADVDGASPAHTGQSADRVGAAVLDVGRAVRLIVAAVAQAQLTGIHLAAVKRERGVEMRVGDIEGIAAVVAHEESVRDGERAVVHRHRAGCLDALSRLVRARAHGNFAIDYDRGRVERVVLRADRHGAAVHVERAEAVPRPVPVRDDAGRRVIVHHGCPNERYLARAADVQFARA